MNVRAGVLSLAVLAACQATRAPAVELSWPVAEVPSAATGVYYEVVVWQCVDGVPARELLHLRHEKGTRVRVDTGGWPPDARWSVRAHWSEGGRGFVSRWLADGKPVDDVRLPSARFARL